MRSVTRVSWAGVVAALVLFVGVGTASAGTVPYFGSCFQNGTATTTPGPLQLRAGWATSTQGLTKKFLEVQQVRYSVNGVSTTTAVGSDTNWSPITQTVNPAGDTLYLTTYTTPVLATLASGQSATVSIVFIATKRVWDDTRTSYPAGALWQERTCTVTAT